MIRSTRTTTTLRAPLALAAALLLAATACSDQPTQPRGPIAGHGAVNAFLAIAPAYTQLDLAVARTFPASTLHLTLIGGGDIPRSADDFINSVQEFGYAWMDGGSGKGIAASIGPNRGWGSGRMQLASGTASSTYCVGGSADISGGMSLHGDILDLNAKESDVGVAATALGTTISYVLQSDAGCGSGTGLVVLSSMTTTMNSGNK